MAQVTLNTRVSIEAHDKLKKFTAETGKSISSVVEKAILEHIKKENEE